MTHEETQAWLTEHGVFPRVTPVAEPGMWHLRKEADGYAEFVHRRTGEVLIFGARIPASKWTSRPDCPCDFCVRVRAEIADRPLGKRRAEQNRRRLPPLVFADQACEGKLVKMTSNNSFIRLRREEDQLLTGWRGF